MINFNLSYISTCSYKHGVLKDLIAPELLRNVRAEIRHNLSFTPKETDIYKIHQSGDLANLDGLEDSSLKLFPSLLKLRNALYSPAFREYLSVVTSSGPLSGRKTDMAINVYTPGCHLLCHDDVIGSRRVSYILYLTDPECPWKEEWGGALRLYPTDTRIAEDGTIVKIPGPDHELSIPPAFNQLSFFAVQPGESFHDVEEVYTSESVEGEAKDDNRVRMAISGWYHIPQKGEDGFVAGLEEKLAEKSSLTQLQGKADIFDLPKPTIHSPVGLEAPANTDDYKSSPGAVPKDPKEDLSLSEEDLNFLLKYLAPTYLTPDTLEQVSEIFTEQWSLTLDTFLSRKFSESLESFILSQESQALPSKSLEIEQKTSWKVARPPHKHRFLFQQERENRKDDAESQSPLQDLLENLLPSSAFYKWLQFATGQVPTSHNLIARRFRRGKDYTLATGYDEDDSRLEITLAITPTPGWEPEAILEPEAEVGEGDEAKGTVMPKAESKPEAADLSSVRLEKEREPKPSRPLEEVPKAELDYKVVGTQEAKLREEGDAKASDLKKDGPKAPESKDGELQDEEPKAKDIELPGEKPRSEEPKISSAKGADLKKEEPNASEAKDEERQEEKVKASAAKDAQLSSVKPMSMESKNSRAKEEEPKASQLKDDAAKFNDGIELERSEATEAKTLIEGGAAEVTSKYTTTTIGEVGGYVTYMAGDDDDDDDDSKMKLDPAIYQADGENDDGSGAALFSMPAGWNKLGIVLRDKGVLRFVKYVSARAKGDRWDICGEYGVATQDDDDYDDDEGDEGDDGDEGGGDGKKGEYNSDLSNMRSEEEETSDEY